jgi:dTMP kinase
MTSRLFLVAADRWTVRVCPYTLDVMHPLSGKFIVFDGPDGCGKTTQLNTLLERLRKDCVVVRRLREPGGTPIGDQVREILLATKNTGMDVRCEMLLYMASRAQLVQDQIKPALAAGECVLTDRYASSTLAYQGGGGGMSAEQILQVAKIAVDGVWPDLTVVFDLDIDQAFARLNSRNSLGAGGGHDRIEQREREYFLRVRENFLWQAKQWPERYRVVDAGQSVLDVAKQVVRVLADFFNV